MAPTVCVAVTLQIWTLICFSGATHSFENEQHEMSTSPSLTEGKTIITLESVSPCHFDDTNCSVSTSPLNQPHNELETYLSNADALGTMIAYIVQYPDNNRFGDLKGSPTNGGQEVILASNISLGQPKPHVASCSGPDGHICWVGKLDRGHDMEIHCFGLQLKTVRQMQVKLYISHSDKIIWDVHLNLDNICENIYWRDPTSYSLWITSLQKASSSAIHLLDFVPVQENRWIITHSLPSGFFYDDVNTQLFDWRKSRASENLMELISVNSLEDFAFIKNYTYPTDTEFRLTVDTDRRVVITTEIFVEATTRRHRVVEYKLHTYGSYEPRVLEASESGDFEDSPGDTKLNNNFGWKAYKDDVSEGPKYFNSYFYWRSTSGAIAAVSSEFFYNSNYNGQLFQDFRLPINATVPEEFTVLIRNVPVTSSPSICSLRVTKCSHTCIPLMNVVSFCECPDYMSLASDNSTCVSNSLLYAQLTDSTGKSDDLLLDPTVLPKESRNFCSIQYPESAQGLTNFPRCPASLVQGTLKKYKFLDPANRGYQHFKRRSLGNVQAAYGGYLYRHADNDRCIYMALPDSPDGVPFFCSEENTEIVEFVADINGDNPILVLLMYRKLSLSAGKMLVYQCVSVYDNAKLSEFLADELPVWMAIYNFKSNITRVGVLETESVVYLLSFSGNNVREYTLSSAPSGRNRVDHYRSEFMVHLNYWLESDGLGGLKLIELDNENSLKRVVLHTKNNSQSSIGFVQLRMFGSSFPLRNKRDACFRCTRSCLILDGLSQCLCPYTRFHRTGFTECKGEIAYFAFYDETLELPLFGKEKLTVKSHHDGSTTEARRVSTVTTRRRQNEICWTYEASQEVHCRNLLKKGSVVTTIGLVHANSTFIQFSEDGAELFYNDGNLGQMFMHSIRLKQVYEFLPFDTRNICASAAWALDTEKKIVFWGTSDGTLSYNILHDGTSGKVSVSQNTNGHNCVTNVAVNQQTEIVYFRISDQPIRWIQYEHIFSSSASEVHNTDGGPPNSVSITDMQLFGTHLFAFTNGFMQRRFENNVRDLRREMTWFDLKLKSTVGIPLQMLYASPGDAYWSDITRGLPLANNSAEGLRTEPVQKLLFLSPPPFVSKSDPCLESSCSYFCFPQSPLTKNASKSFVCACPKHLYLVNDTYCTDSGYGVVVGTLSGAAALAVVVLLAVQLLRQYRRNRDLVKAMQEVRNGNPEAAAAAKSEADKAQYLPLACIISSNELVVHAGKVLGEGNFGLVLEGTYNGTAVAVKTIKSCANPKVLSDLGKEAKIMHYIGDHPNIVKLYGVEINQQGNMRLAMELSTSGALLSKLRSLDPKPGLQRQYINVETDGSGHTLIYDNLQECLEPWFDTLEYRFLDWAEQIAQGMQYLSSKNIIHGDLAARNVLLFKNDVVKISDFGLSKRLYNSANYAKRTNALLPWRWMAYESLKKLEFSSKSDVWSYGVTAWEIFSFGDTPLGGLQWNQDYMNRLEQCGFGSMVRKPQHALDIIYEKLMLPCWIIDPELRPDFESSLAVLKNLKEEVKAIATQGFERIPRP